MKIQHVVFHLGNKVFKFVPGYIDFRYEVNSITGAVDGIQISEFRNLPDPTDIYIVNADLETGIVFENCRLGAPDMYYVESRFPDKETFDYHLNAQAVNFEYADFKSEVIRLIQEILGGENQ